MVLLMQAIGDELGSYAAKFAFGHHFQLSITAPAGFDHYNKLHLARFTPILDYFNLMAYDYTGHNANLYSNDGMARSTPFDTLQGNVRAEKLVLGVPIYGRSFQETSGLGKPFIGVGSGSWDEGAWDYKVRPKEGSILSFDDTAHAYYVSYDATTRELISYDQPEAIQKNELVRSR